MSRELEPIDWQEQHSPTRWHEVRGDVRIDGALNVRREVIGVARRRVTDAWIGELGPAHQAALQEIERAHKHHVRGLGPQIARYDARVSRGVFDIDRLEDLIQQYLAWQIECRAQGIDVQAVMAVVADGFYPRTIDRARGKRHGWAKDHLDRALELWINWKRAQRMAASAAS